MKKFFILLLALLMLFSLCSCEEAVLLLLNQLIQNGGTGNEDDGSDEKPNYVVYEEFANVNLIDLKEKNKGSLSKGITGTYLLFRDYEENEEPYRVSYMVYLKDDHTIKAARVANSNGNLTIPLTATGTWSQTAENKLKLTLDGVSIVSTTGTDATLDYTDWITDENAKKNFNYTIKVTDAEKEMTLQKYSEEPFTLMTGWDQLVGLWGRIDDDNNKVGYEFKSDKSVINYSSRGKKAANITEVPGEPAIRQEFPLFNLVEINPVLFLEGYLCLFPYFFTKVPTV